jgi:hypothetical protein
MGCAFPLTACGEVAVALRVLKKGLFERLGSGVLCAEDMGFIA